MPAAIQIGGRHGGQRVEPQHHALAAYDEIQQRRDGKEGQKEPPLLVDLFELPAERIACHEGCVSRVPCSTKIFRQYEAKVQSGTSVSPPSECQMRVTTLSNGLRAMSGTVAPAAGCPTTRIRNGRSLDGRPRMSFRNRIGLGVCVREASPA